MLPAPIRQTNRLQQRFLPEAAVSMNFPYSACTDNSDSDLFHDVLPFALPELPNNRIFACTEALMASLAGIK